jgi:histidine triad (HIT) family protein
MRRGGSTFHAPGIGHYGPMPSEKPCLFCAIAAREEPAGIVLDEGDAADHAVRFMAFLDHRPLFKGHTLLIPRRHYETLVDLPADGVGPLLSHAQRLAQVMETTLGAAGSFVAINNRVSQSVPHLHLHVVPRQFKDGLRGFFWPRTRYADDAEMAGYAARLRVGLAESDFGDG